MPAADESLFLEEDLRVITVTDSYSCSDSEGFPQPPSPSENALWQHLQDAEAILSQPVTCGPAPYPTSTHVKPGAGSDSIAAAARVLLKGSRRLRAWVTQIATVREAGQGQVPGADKFCFREVECRGVKVQGSHSYSNQRSFPQSLSSTRERPFPEPTERPRQPGEVS